MLSLDNDFESDCLTFSSLRGLNNFLNKSKSLLYVLVKSVFSFCCLGVIILRVDVLFLKSQQRVGTTKGSRQHFSHKTIVSFLRYSSSKMGYTVLWLFFSRIIAVPQIHSILCFANRSARFEEHFWVLFGRSSNSAAARPFRCRLKNVSESG